MKKFYCCLLLLVWGMTSYAQIDLNIESPSLDGASYFNGEPVIVRVSVTTSNALASMKGTLDDKPINLRVLAPGLYGDTLYLDGLPFGDRLLKATATDVQNNTKTATRRILHEDPPKLLVNKTVNNGVARPVIRFKARATDNGSIDYIRLMIHDNPDWPYDGIERKVAGDSLDVTIDLSSWEGNELYATFWAYDNRGFEARETSTIYVDSNPYLNEYFVAPDHIRGFKYNKALQVMGALDRNVRIINIADNTATSVPVPRSVNFTPYLTPQGLAYVITDTQTTDKDSIYDWNNGALAMRQRVYSHSYYNTQAEGNYLLFVDADSLILRNLATKANLGIMGSAPDDYKELALAPNGLAAFIRYSSLSGYDLTKFHNNSSPLITTSPADTPLTALATDGQNIAFLKGNAVMLHDGNSLTTVDIGADTRFERNLKVNNGYLAYPKSDSFGQVQIWLRDPQHNKRQLTTFGNTNNPVILGLSPGGNMIVSTAFGTYYLEKSGAIRKVSSLPSPRIVYENGKWFIIEGRTIFQVNVDTTIQYTVSQFEKSVKYTGTSDGYVKFPANDFVQHYSGPATGPGQLAKVKLTRGPAYGTLRVTSKVVSTGSILLRSDLDKLTYSPSGAGIGRIDSLRWSAAPEGLDFTRDTFLLMHIYRGFAYPPAIPGLDTVYCSGATLDTVKIGAYPVPSQRATISVTVDSTTILPVKDSAFVINPADYVRGKHKLRITFTNPADTIFTVKDFIIGEGGAAIVDLTAAKQAVNRLDSVILYAFNKTAGQRGTPLYTFAKDSQFKQILRAESKVDRHRFSAKFLAYGRNILYVRMRMINSCSTNPVAIDTVHVTKLAPPALPAPVVAGFTSGQRFCQRATPPIVVTIKNVPSPAVGNVKVEVDQNSVYMTNDSTFNLYAAGLSPGQHTLKVSFYNELETKTTSFSWTVLPTVIAEVDLTALPNPVTNPRDTVYIWATDQTVGNHQALYWFSWNRAFTKTIQPEGPSDTLKLHPSALKNGDNKIYVRIRIITSDTCFWRPSSVDSITVVKNVTALAPAVAYAGGDKNSHLRGNDGGTITAYPNPFTESFTVTGLSPAKTYTLSLYDLQGKLILQRKVYHQRKTDIYKNAQLGKGTYLLHIFDDQKEQPVRTIKLLHL